MTNIRIHKQHTANNQMATCMVGEFPEIDQEATWACTTEQNISYGDGPASSDQYSENSGGRS